MNNKLTVMENHLKNHPNDYQTAISYLKACSREVDYQRKKHQDEMKRKIAMYKRGVNNGE